MQINLCTGGNLFPHVRRYRDRLRLLKPDAFDGLLERYAGLTCISYLSKFVLPADRKRVALFV
jgi:hypothetical protein